MREIALTCEKCGAEFQTPDLFSELFGAEAEKKTGVCPKCEAAENAKHVGEYDGI